MKIEILYKKLEALVIHSWPDLFDHYVTLEITLGKYGNKIRITAMAWPDKAGREKARFISVEKSTLSAAATEFTKKVMELNNKIETEEQVKL